jgi:hypothetical protein
MATLRSDSRPPRYSDGRQPLAEDDIGQIGHLRRVVDRDIQILRMNLVQCHDESYVDEAWGTAWARAESAGDTVRSELAGR